MVPKMMRSRVVGQSGRAYGRAEDASLVMLLAVPVALRRGEDRSILGRWVLRDMCGQRVNHDGRQRQRLA